MFKALPNVASLVGRAALAALFILSGIGKITHPDETASFMAGAGLPEISALAILVGMFEVAAGSALAVGYRVRAAATLLGAFTLVATVLFHAFWSAAGEMQVMQQLLFMKNVGVFGGLLVVAAVGAGEWGFDTWLHNSPMAVHKV